MKTMLRTRVNFHCMHRVKTVRKGLTLCVHCGRRI